MPWGMQDYYNLNFTRMLGTDPTGMAALMAIVDPINYVDNMTMPKLVVDATGDEFFMPGADGERQCVPVAAY